MIPWII